MYKTQYLIFLCIFCLGMSKSFAQPSYLSHEAFRGTRIINGHSVETLVGGELEMIIGHRFGRLNDGFYELFGLDQATIRIGFDYGITNNLMIGFGRSSLGKEFDGFLKYRLLSQDQNRPWSLSILSTISYNSLKDADPEKPISSQHRFAYVNQILIAHKFSDYLTVQLMPIMAHYNLVENNTEGNDKFALGIGAKYQISKNLALTSEYAFMPAQQRPAGSQNALSFGLDINTGSHVFQLHFTNAAGMIEKQFIGETTGQWKNGDIHFGFNMVRTFKLRGRRY